MGGHIYAMRPISTGQLITGLAACASGGLGYLAYDMTSEVTIFDNLELGGRIVPDLEGDESLYEWSQIFDKYHEQFKGIPEVDVWPYDPNSVPSYRDISKKLQSACSKWLNKSIKNKESLGEKINLNNIRDWCSLPKGWEGWD